MAEMEKDLAVEQLELAKGIQSSNTHASGNVDLLDANGEVRRIPIPSADPNDPLNLNKWRKLGVVVTCCWFSIFSLVLVGGAGPILPAWMELYAPQGVDMQSVVNLTTYPSLVMGVGAFVILPASMMFGRRPVFLLCCLLVLASTIAAGESNSYNTHLACRLLQGIATGATESVLPLIITDITFLDERGFFFGCYWGTQNLINTIFTITGSYIVADLNWRWFYYILAIFCGIGTALAFFLLPETRYQRSPLSMNGQVHHTDEFGVTQILSDDEARARFGATVGTSEDESTYRQKTYIESLNPVSPVAPHATKLGLSVLAKMASSLSSPAVIWAVMAASIMLGSGIAISLTYGSILTEGFGWSNASVGLVNCGIFPSALSAMFFAGYLGDKMNLWLARRRGGEHLPEHTLVTLIFPIIVAAIGIAIYGVTANNPAERSYWGIIMGWTLQQFGAIVVLITTTHFAAEAYPQNPGPALTVVVGLKNVISFGASFGIVPMVHKLNYLTAYMILFGIFTAIFALGIPVYFLNPKWRAAVARRQ